MIKRRIKVVDATAKHLETLKGLGYEGIAIEEHNGVPHLVFEVTEVVEDVVDMSSKEKMDEVLKDVITNHKCFSYSTKFLFAGYDNPLFGGVAARKLGAAGALICKAMPGGKKASSKGYDIEALKALAAK